MELGSHEPHQAPLHLLNTRIPPPDCFPRQTLVCSGFCFTLSSNTAGEFRVTGVPAKEARELKPFPSGPSDACRLPRVQKGQKCKNAAAGGRLIEDQLPRGEQTCGFTRNVDGGVATRGEPQEGRKWFHGDNGDFRSSPCSTDGTWPTSNKEPRRFHRSCPRDFCNPSKKGAPLCSEFTGLLMGGKMGKLACDLNAVSRGLFPARPVQPFSPFREKRLISARSSPTSHESTAPRPSP